MVILRLVDFSHALHLNPFEQPAERELRRWISRKARLRRNRNSEYLPQRREARKVREENLTAKNAEMQRAQSSDQLGAKRPVKSTLLVRSLRSWRDDFVLSVFCAMRYALCA